MQINPIAQILFRYLQPTIIILDMKKQIVILILASLATGLFLESCSPEVTAKCPAYKYSVRGRRGR